MLEILKAALIGIVQGITEWLPISSTGHMILFDEFIKLDVTPEFMNMFLVLIQFGSILAVVVLYWRRLNPFSRKNTPAKRREVFSMWGKVIVAMIPAGVIGMLFDNLLTSLFYWYIPVAIALIVYGVLFIILENRNKYRTPKITSIGQLDYKTAFAIGCFQALALIPGTSRSGSTILGSILVGTSRQVAAEFSFFLAVPVMFGASLVKLLGFGFNFSASEVAIMLAGMAVAFIVSIIAIRFLISFIKKRDFKPFGWYRIILGVILIIYFFASK